MRSIGLSITVIAALGAAILWWTRDPEPHRAPGSVATQPASGTAAAEERRRAVEATVATRNREAEAQRHAFEADGWTFVDVAAPDADLVAASPTLLATREAELRVQLASAPPSIEHLANVVAIASSARDAATRSAAVEAIAKMGPGAPQHALVELLPKLAANDPARRALVPLLQPASTSDAFAGELIALLDSPALASDEAEQIALTLALLSLRDGTELDQPMSPFARALIERMTLVARRTRTASRS